MSYQKDMQQKRRRHIIDLAGGNCIECGSTKRLEFDHIDPSTKVFQISGSHLLRSMDKIMEEVKKCQLLCRSCHMKKTWAVDRHRAVHGTSSSYTLGCRCSACTVARREYNKIYKLRKKLALVT